MSYHRPDFTPPQPHFAAAPMAYYSTAARMTTFYQHCQRPSALCISQPCHMRRLAIS